MTSVTEKTQEQPQISYLSQKDGVWYWHPYVRASMYVIAFFCFLIGVGIVYSPIQLEPIMNSYFPSLVIEKNLDSVWVQITGVLILVVMSYVGMLFAWYLISAVLRLNTTTPWDMLRETSGVMDYFNSRILNPVALIMDRGLTAAFLSIPVIMLVSLLPTWSDEIEKKSAIFLMMILILNATIPPHKFILFSRKLKQ